MSNKNTYNTKRDRVLREAVLKESIVNSIPALHHYVYSGEQEEEDWQVVLTTTPILAMGSGAFSESAFGFYHPMIGTITKLVFNAYPVEADSEYSVRIKILGRNDNEYMFPDTITFTGNMESKNVSLVLPYDENQIIVEHLSSTYPSSPVRIRISLHIN